MENPLKYFLPVYLAAYFFAAFFWRSYAVWKRTNVNPLVFKGSDNSHDYIGRVFKLMFGAIVAVVVIYSTSERLYQYLMPIGWLEPLILQSAGVVLLLMSLAWTVVAEAQMGESWRIGIDQDHRTPLVRKGVFGLSRNPIFLGMMITLLGLFLVIPNTLTLLTFVMGVVLIQIQVRLEEEFLGRVHGEEYAEYRRNVRRWL
ncbi:MAG TPA: isoprenylcysteine carboxylmethyltransferase family protein [Pyrinomonadaceae bacterium]|nr:isoprenylcysteine carboxylmethyltransferase family protein [Pyrinomonadaceae bacterium]